MTKCFFEPCNNSVYCKNLCSAHYTQNRRGGPLKPIVVKSNSSLLPCSFEGCVNNQQAKGLCGAHWRQQHLGKSLSKLRNQESILERIMPQVEKTEYCWIWRGRVSGKNKYPQISLGGTQTMVHRIVFEELSRQLDPGETLDHLCRNRICINPNHLEAVPLRENVKRMHAWRSLERENKRLVDFVELLGYDSRTLQLKEN
jgi:hypothetical protein